MRIRVYIIINKKYNQNKITFSYDIQENDSIGCFSF